MPARIARGADVILAVGLLQQALRLEHASPLELLCLGLGILLVGGALFLGYRRVIGADAHAAAPPLERSSTRG